MVVPDAATLEQAGARIVSKIRRLVVVIDCETIAKALYYNRPAAQEINYPRDDFAIRLMKFVRLCMREMLKTLVILMCRVGSRRAIN